MQAMGFGIPNPNGAFYVFAKIPDDLIQDDTKFCYDLVRTSAVAVIPGGGFGPGGEGHIRLSYAASMANLTEAMRRLQTYVDQYRAAHHA